MSNNLNLPRQLGNSMISSTMNLYLSKYGDMGTIIIDALQSKIRIAIYQEFQNAFRQTMFIDEFQFLRYNIFYTFYISIRSAIISIPGMIDVHILNVIIDAYFNWVHSFVNTRLSKDKSRSISESQVLSLSRICFKIVTRKKLLLTH